MMKISLGKYNLILEKKEKSTPQDQGTSLKDINMIEFVSHELKGILGSTILFVYSIRDGLYGFLNFKQKNCIEAAIRNLSRLDSTIRDFLDLSRIEEGKIDLSRTEIEIRDLIVQEVIDTYSSEIFEKKINIKINIGEKVRISANRNLMITIFNNLIGNAIKYGTENGNIILDSEVHEKFSRFSIYNDGIPLNDSESEIIFKKFSRLEDKWNKKTKGTGLGLFIVKKIVEHSSGKIWHEPREKGNIFIFEIERTA